MDKNSIALQLDEAAAQAKPIAQISINTQFNEEEAYAIQKLAIDERLRRGETITGIKLGFTSYAKMEQMGVHDMIWGRLTSSMMIPNKGTLNMSKFIHPRAEPELCFLLKKKVDKEIELKDIPEYISHVAAAIEVIDSRYENFKFSLEDVIADNCSSSAYVIGAWKALPESLKDIPMQMLFDQEVVADGDSSAILGNPYLSVINAFRLALKYGQTLEVGNIIFAGAATAAQFLKKETKVSANMAAMGAVEFNVI